MKKALAIWAVIAWSLAAYGQSGTDPLTLYRDLRTVGLDAAKVYRVRDVTLDRPTLHLSFTDGTIAFTKAVDGRVTGAFFEGEGEVLVRPPNQVERASLALFTGAAILEQGFTTAYLRFNDDTPKEFEGALQPYDKAEDFRTRWNSVSTTLADGDALRLLRSFVDAPRRDDHMLHARVGGGTLGTFDISYDSLAGEPVTLAQAAHVEDGTYYDIWTSYAPPRDEQSAREPNLRIGDYHIHARILPPHDLEAEAELSITAGRAGERVLTMELSQFLKVSAVTVRQGAGEAPAEFLQNEAIEGSRLSRRGNDLVTVILPKPLGAGERAQIKFSYAGPVMTEAGGGLMYVGARGIWYPNRGPAMANFDLQFRSPEKWVLLATGKRVQSESNGGEQISRWVSEHPIPLAGFNVGQYERATAKAGNVVVAAYAARGVENNFPRKSRIVLPPQNVPQFPHPADRRAPVLSEVFPEPPSEPAVHAQKVAELSARTIDWVSRRLSPFPFSSLALTQMPGPVSQGWPGLVFLSSYVFMADEQREQREMSGASALLFSKLMPAHETLHQWWGDEVLWRSYRDQWISEGLSNYLALMTIEKERPADVRNVLDRYRADLLQKNKDDAEMLEGGPVTLGVRLTSSKFPNAYEAVTYGRGTWLFHMLRELLREGVPAATAKSAKSRADARDSDELFFSALRSLSEQFRGKRISTDDVKKAFEAVLPPSAQYEGRKSLDWFFDGWVNGTAVPHFELADVKFAQRAGRTVATGKLARREAPSTLVAAVPLYASTATGVVYAGRVFSDEDETSFRLNVPPGTKKLLVDPNGTLLARP